jgi:hypothetical protein
MLSATTYTIRLAAPEDDAPLRWVADVGSPGPLPAARAVGAAA